MKIETIDTADPLEIFSAIRGVSKAPFILTGAFGFGDSGYSYIGCDPYLVIRSGGTGEPFNAPSGPTGPSGQTPQVIEAEDPFAALSEILKEKKRAPGPYPFSGGAVGYFSYDLKDITLPLKKVSGAMKTAALPSSILALYDPVIVMDHSENTVSIVSSGDNGSIKRVLAVKAAVYAARDKTPSGRPGKKTGTGLHATFRISGPSANLTREEYIDRVRRAKDYIAAGDIYQINISQNYRASFEGDPFALYSAILRERPAPFSSYMDLGSLRIISNTPERLLRVEGGYAWTEPIKGTRPRGRDGIEDRHLANELRESAKERAEHVMIVDLERNDLGRFSETGSVEVLSFERIETLPGLHHMISTIRGRIRKGLDTAECLKSFFPGGSITGAPKVRAAQIIDELEAGKRGIYTGAIGWVDLSGEADLSMAIRTAVHTEGELSLSVGSGIVADSIPEEEYDETVLKAGDFFNFINKETGKNFDV